MYEQSETRPWAGGGPFEHLEIAVRISERHNGPASDMLLDGDRLAFFVVNKVQFCQSSQNRLSIADFESGLDAAADNLFGRNSIDLMSPRAHEFDTAP